MQFLHKLIKVRDAIDDLLEEFDDDTPAQEEMIRDVVTVTRSARNRRSDQNEGLQLVPTNGNAPQVEAKLKQSRTVNPRISATIRPFIEEAVLAGPVMMEEIYEHVGKNIPKKILAMRSRGGRVCYKTSSYAIVYKEIVSGRYEEDDKGGITVA